MGEVRIAWDKPQFTAALASPKLGESNSGKNFSPDDSIHENSYTPESSNNYRTDDIIQLRVCDRHTPE
jgi:hypothetical protein